MFVSNIYILMQKMCLYIIFTYQCKIITILSHIVGIWNTVSLSEKSNIAKYGILQNFCNLHWHLCLLFGLICVAHSAMCDTNYPSIWGCGEPFVSYRIQRATQIGKRYTSFPYTTQIIYRSSASRLVMSDPCPTQIGVSGPTQFVISLLVSPYILNLSKNTSTYP